MFGRRCFKKRCPPRSGRNGSGRHWRWPRGSPGVVVVALLLAWSTLVLTPMAAQAAELRQGDAVVIPAGETIEDDLYVFGQTVTIDGTVHGDVFAVGQSVAVAGTVTGDLMAAGTSVVVTGPVEGSARLAGQTVEIAAPIGDDLLVGAATLNVGPRGQIGRDVLVGGGTVTIAGPVARSIRAAAESLAIGGSVGGDVMAQAGTLRLVSGADIQGSLSYTSERAAIVEAGATVVGTTTRVETSPPPAPPSPAARFGEGVLAWFRTFVGLAAFSLVLVLVFPGYMLRSTEALVEAPWASLGLGSALLVGVPVAALLLFAAGLLVGGWWLGLLALALYVLMLPVGCAIVGLFVGRLVMHRIGRPGVASGWSLLAGLAVLGLVSLVPVAGGLAILAALIFGLGAGTLALKATYHQQATEQPTTAAGTPTPPRAPADRFGEPIPAR